MSDQYFPIYLQYQNSPKLISLVNKTANALLFKDINFTNDYLNIRTASSEGLDNWGIILNQPRIVYSGEAYDNVFGFNNGFIPLNTTDYPQNFYYSNFFNIVYSPTIAINDDQYRALLLLIYRKYTTNNSIYDLNNIIQEYSEMMGASGVPYVKSNYDMSITYKFNYYLLPYEAYMFNRYNILPKPAGVKLIIEQ